MYRDVKSSITVIITTTGQKYSVLAADLEEREPNWANTLYTDAVNTYMY